MKSPEQIADELLAKYDAGYDKRTSLDVLIAATIQAERDRAKILEEALEWIMPKVHQAHHTGELLDCFISTCQEYCVAMKRYRERE